MKAQNHPEKYDALVAPNETENTTIHAARAFAAMLDHLGIGHGPIIAGAPGTGAEILVDDMVNEGVSADRPYQLSIPVNNQTLNIGVAINFFRSGADPLTALAQDLLAVDATVTREKLIAAIVNSDSELRSGLNKAVAALVEPAIRYDGGY